MANARQHLLRILFIAVLMLLLSRLPVFAQELDAEGGLVVDMPGAGKEEKKAEPPPEPEVMMIRGVKLRALNKITARSSVIDAQIGIVARFGNLEILTRDCWKAPETEQPENAALLDIWDRKMDEKPVRVFYGWMFASSPSLSTLEHPVYEITVIECSAKPMGESGKEDPAAAASPLPKGQ